jgi:hypothetical protein
MSMLDRIKALVFVDETADAESSFGGDFDKI